MQVITYGCPRAGTTYLNSIFQKGVGIDSYKLPEWADLHPCQSSDGFLKLAQLYGKDLIVVRIVRDPLEIVRSFLFAREASKNHDDLHGIASNSDAQIIRMIEAESRNTHHQLDCLNTWPWSQWKFKFTTLNYRHLYDLGALADWFDPKTIKAMTQYIGETVAVSSCAVRDGRLKRRAHDFELTNAQRDKFRLALKDVIRRDIGGRHVT